MDSFVGQVASERVVAALATLVRELVAPVVREAVEDVLAGLAPTPPTALLTTDELGYQLRVSRTTLHRLRGEGLPCIHIGDSPRYRLDAVLAWLEARA